MSAVQDQYITLVFVNYMLFIIHSCIFRDQVLQTTWSLSFVLLLPLKRKLILS